jgi:hypothetical protein
MADTLTRTINYGRYEGQPAVFNNTEAYVFNGVQWDKASVADMLNNTGVVNKEKFDFLYPALPPLPKGAFLTKTDG